MTEYGRWIEYHKRFGAETVQELPSEVQELMNEIPVAFTKAATDVGIIVLPYMTGPVGIWEDKTLQAGSRRLETPGSDFYSQFLNEFVASKERGLRAVAYYISDVMQYGGGTTMIDPVTFEKVEVPYVEPSYGYKVRYATIFE